MSRILADALRAHVYELSERLGERSPRRPEALRAAAEYARSRFAAYGYRPETDAYEAAANSFENVLARRPGAGGGAVLVVGAHYDTVAGTPGADDNASGVAALLELARLLGEGRGRAELLFAAFAAEEA